MNLAKIKVNDFGGAPVAEHNYPCPIHRDLKAVYIVGQNYFQPSWTAQKKGWRLVKFDSWWKGKLLDWFFSDYR